MSKAVPKFLLALLTLGLLTLPVAAQITSLTDPLPREAQVALDEARNVAAEALEVYSAYHPDQPLFRQAITLGREAVALAPDNTETLRFLAELYGVTDFYGPAFATWQRYVAAGGTLDTNASAQFAESGNAFGYARYTSGDLEGALAAYKAVAAEVPGNVRAQRWSGRILLEQNRPRAALPYWQRVKQLEPDDASVDSFISLARAGERYGMDAARAFYDGVTAFEAGQREAARRDFARATQLNPDYAAAWGYLGRINFEAGRFARAETAYARASELEPQNATYSYFLRQAEANQTRGAE